MVKLTSKDWVRMLISFLLGVAVTLLVIQLTGGQLFQGFLTKTLYIAPTITTEKTLDYTGTSLSTSIERLDSGLELNTAVDDEAGLSVGDTILRKDALYLVPKP